jgi:hypothetical protein
MLSMHPIVELIRLEENENYGTFGVLRIMKQVFCVTLEPADLENASFVSSIPAQQYLCELHVSPKYGETFQVMNVPHRDSVLFHPGNRVKDTKGCIILAEHFGKLQGDRAVLNSGNTFKRFMHLAKQFQTLHLTIIEAY